MNKTKELSKYEKISVNRIKNLIQTRCDGSQKKFAERTGLNAGSVSQYVKGRNVPSSLNAQKIAQAFDIEPEWVMGFEPAKHGSTGHTIQITDLKIYEQGENAHSTPVYIAANGGTGKSKCIGSIIAPKDLLIHDDEGNITNVIEMSLTEDEQKILDLYRAGKLKEIVSLMMDKMTEGS
jgi:transcriptional regulator with XRE-family HTH domain